MMKKPEEWLELISQGESESLELKQKLPVDSAVARTLSAFANTSGGTLILGVGKQGNIVGLTETEVNRAVVRIHNIVSSLFSWPVDYGSFDLNDRHLVYVAVRKAPKNLIPVITSDGTAYIRQGASTVRIDLTQLAGTRGTGGTNTKAVRVQRPQRDQVFISYSHKDRKLFDQLQTSLKPLVRDKKISLWDDTKIKSGDAWREEIKAAIASAKVAVLLVSPDFLASDFIAEHELPPLIEAAQNEGLKILWIAARFSMYEETEIVHYQAVNDPTRPLASISGANREREIIRICKEIKSAVLDTLTGQDHATTYLAQQDEASTRPQHNSAKQVEVAEEPQIQFYLTPKLPCLLLLDVSGSMSGEPIELLTAGLKSFVEDLKGTPVLAERVELALITYGSYASIVRDFTPVYQFPVPELEASGATAMAEAIELGLDLIGQRKRDYKSQGIPYYKPLVLMLADGMPSDDWQGPVNRLHKESSLRRLTFIPVGLEGADMGFLTQISPPGLAPIKLNRLRFSEMFRWLSSNIKSVSRHATDAKVELSSPTGWDVI